MIYCGDIKMQQQDQVENTLFAPISSAFCLWQIGSKGDPNPRGIPGPGQLHHNTDSTAQARGWTDWKVLKSVYTSGCVSMCVCTSCVS